MKIKNWSLIKKNSEKTVWQSDITGHIVDVEKTKDGFWSLYISGKYQYSGSRQKMEDMARAYMKNYISSTLYSSHANKMQREGFDVKFDIDKNIWLIKE